MAKEYSKQQKLDTVERKEKYVKILENCVLKTQQKFDSMTEDTFEKSLIEKQLFELKESLKINTEIANDFRAEYKDIFLPQYEKRLEDCAKNFDKCYELVKKNAYRLEKTNPLYVSIIAYEKENPDNDDEDKMLIFYEKIKPFAEMIRKNT